MSVLRHHSKLFKAYQHKKHEIDYMYDTRVSVASRSVFRKSTGNYSDPVKEAVFRIDEEREKLLDLWNHILDEELEIFSWLDTIPDHHFRTIIIYRFIIGYTWERVDYEMSRETGETYTGSASATYYKRYIAKHPELIEPEE